MENPVRQWPPAEQQWNSDGTRATWQQEWIEDARRIRDFGEAEVARHRDAEEASNIAYWITRSSATVAEQRNPYYDDYNSDNHPQQQRQAPARVRASQGHSTPQRQREGERQDYRYDQNVHVVVTNAAVTRGNFEYQTTTTITPEGTTRSTRETQRNPGHGGPSESTGGGHSSGSRYEPYAPTTAAMIATIDADSRQEIALQEIASSDAVAHLRSSGNNRRRNR